MGRPNEHGLKYLRYDGETHIYTYVRQLNERIRKYVVGSILIPESTRVSKLTGKPVVKISLGATDKNTVRDYHAAVHAQVNEIVARAEQRVQRDDHASKTMVELHDLPDDKIAIIAEQMRRDILDHHDKEVIDPETTSPMVGVILKIMQKLGKQVSDPIAAAQQAARTIEGNLAKSMIARRELDNLDRPMKEYDFNLDRPGLNNLREEHVGVVLPQAALAVLLDRKPTNEGQSEIDTVLAKNGASLPQDQPDRQRLALAITRAKVQAFSDIENREEGAPILTPIRPVLLLPQPSDKISRLSELHLEWAGKARLAPKTVNDNKLYVDRFIKINGDLLATDIKPNHIKRFRDILKLFPRNMPKDMRAASIEDIVAFQQTRAAADPDAKPLGWFTINEKGIRGISKLLQIAIDSGEIAKNPCNKMYLDPDEETDGTERRIYDINELKLVFSSGIYQRPPQRPLGGAGEAARWLPLIALFSAMRLEEIGQLRVEDIKVSSDGIVYFLVATASTKKGALIVADKSVDISNKADPSYLTYEAWSAAAKLSAQNRKSVKTAAGRRRVPVHNELIKCGFLEYVREQAKKGDRLFPDLKYDKDGHCTPQFSKWYGRFLGSLGLHDDELVFHSFRHTFTSKHAEGGNPEVLKALIGHSKTKKAARNRVRRDPTDGYRHFSMEILNAEVQRVKYESLDLSHLYEDVTQR